jgi:hypothetical protein
VDKLVDALVRLTDACSAMGMRVPAAIWLETREEGLILYTEVCRHVRMTGRPPVPDDFGNWCAVYGIKFRWP